ncbi:hypothetical protein [Spiribacter onubensis]|uniref:ParB/Sulfiredoxin domain-containing protein n=1 Tax=Spiribacter onubensis TaxID=3122420 RepID=A0ABV3S6R9_9GAMM
MISNNTAKVSPVFATTPADKIRCNLNRSQNPSGIKLEEYIVTPDMAQFLIDNHCPDFQRKLRERWALDIANKMRRGEWTLMPAQVAIDEDGNVINGQHTLRAISIYGSPIEVSIAFDVPTDRFAHFDQSMRRQIHELINRDRGHTSVAVVLDRMQRGGKARSQSPELVERMINAFEQELEAFFRLAKNQAVTRTPAPFKAGVILAMARSGSWVEIIDEYNTFVTDDMARMSPLQLAAWKKIQAKLLGHGYEIDRTHAKVVTGFKAFTPSHKDKTRVVTTIHDLEYLRNLIERILEERT